MTAREATTWRIERRKERRSDYRVEKPAYAILENGSYTDIRLLDLSYEGCRIECSVELRVGDRLKLAVQGRGVIEAEVRRYCDGKAGVVFKPRAPSQDPWPRRAARVSVSADVTLRRFGKTAYPISVFDISPYGCRVEFIDQPAIDEHVWIRLPGLEPLEAEVCWVERPHAGLSFVNDIHPAVFDLLLARLRPARR